RNAPPPVLPPLRRQPPHRHYALVLGGREHDHALRRAPRDADAVDRAADELAAVGDQHDLVGFLDRERGHQTSALVTDFLCALAALEHVHRDDTFAAAIGDPVFERRGALAEAAL